MSARVKWAVAIATLFLAIIAASYLAGWLVIELLRISAPLNGLTFWRYFQARDLAAFQPYAGRIKFAGCLGFSLAGVAWLGLWFLLMRRQKRTTYGDARFASRSDIGKTGMLTDDATGIIVGKYEGRFLRLPGTRHVLLAAGTRSGKGVGFVIPNGLHYAGSFVMFDMKQEGFDKASKARSLQGPVFLFNPVAEDLRTHRWNPFAYVRADILNRASDLQAISECLYKQTPGQDPFWTNTARTAFEAAASLLFDQWQQAEQSGVEAHELYPTLGAIYRLFSGDGHDLKAYFKSLLAQPGVTDATRIAFGNVTSLPEQTFSSVLGCAQAPLLIFASRVLDKATSGNDFDLRNLRRVRQSIFVGVAPNKLGEARDILNLFFQQAIKFNTDVTPQKDPTVKHQCLFLLDEFAALGRIDCLVDGVSYVAGYNVRLACIIQSLSQLDDVYGPDKARTMVTNLACRVIFAPSEQRDANEFSEMLGYTTERKKQRTRSSGGHVSYTDIEERRALMLPQELKALSPKKQIVFVEGSAHPVMSDKIRYYEDKDCMPKLLGAIEVPKLEL